MHHVDNLHEIILPANYTSAIIK